LRTFLLPKSVCLVQVGFTNWHTMQIQFHSLPRPSPNVQCAQSPQMRKSLGSLALFELYDKAVCPDRS
jgi:hypothetical protein